MVAYLIIIGIVGIIIGLLYKMYAYDKSDGSMKDWSQTLGREKYDPNMTRFKAKKETIASESRSSLLANLRQEVTEMANVITAEASAQMAQFAKEDTGLAYSLQRELTTADHELQLAMKHNQINANLRAAEFGLSPAAFENLVLEQARMQTQLAMEERKMLLEVEKDKGFKKNDLFLERSLANLSIELNNIANLLDQHKYKILDSELHEMHLEYERIKVLDESEYKEREVRRIGSKIKKWEEQLYE